MTTMAISQLILDTPSVLQRLGQRFAALVEGVGEARIMAERYKTLSRMTDAQLARQGLKRADIPQAVLAGGSR